MHGCQVHEGLGVQGSGKKHKKTTCNPRAPGPYPKKKMVGVGANYLLRVWARSPWRSTSKKEIVVENGGKPGVHG